jgi:hypothetical protein
VRVIVPLPRRNIVRVTHHFNQTCPYDKSPFSSPVSTSAIVLTDVLGPHLVPFQAQYRVFLSLNQLRVPPSCQGHRTGCETGSHQTVHRK